MYGVSLLGVRRLILSIAKMARVDVGLDDAQPNLRADGRTLRQAQGERGIFGKRTILGHVLSFAHPTVF